MSKRKIYVPGVEAWVSLGAYLEFVKEAKAHPDARFKHTLQGWWSGTGAEIMQEFRRGMMDRINQAIPYNERGAKQAN
jgi:hypothetical protein